MAASRGPHVKDIFLQKSTPVNNFVTTTYPESGFHFDKKPDTTKTKFKSTKKSAAPPRPTFNNYKPKILQADSIVKVPISHYKPPAPVVNETQNDFRAKPLIIGDKDVPIVIEPMVPNEEEVYTEIPDDSFSEVVAGSGPIHNEEQTTTNPLFDDEKSSSDHSVIPHLNHSSDAHKSHTVKHETIVEEINGVSVPEPDYDEDEVVMEFDGEVDVDAEDVNKNRPKSVYKDFQGEDFSMYLNDELENEPNVSKQTSNGHLKNRTEGKRFKKRESRTTHTMFGNANKNGKYKSGSVRCYSVEDTKLGLSVDGSVRESSLRSGVDYGTTYESFLNSRHGSTVVGGGVDNRGLDIGETSKYNVNEKNTLWKKLTWRLKRQIVLMH